MKSVSKTTVRVIGYCFISVILCVALYCLLLPLALNYDGPTTAAFLKRMLFVGFLADVICSTVVYLVYRPTERALRTLDDNGTVTEEDFRKAGRAMNSIPTFLFFFGTFSYLVAYGLNVTVDIAKNALPSMDQVISRVVGAASFGILNGLLTERLLNIIFIRVKVKLGILSLEQLNRFQKFRSMRRRLVVPSVVLFVFIIAFSGISYFNLSKANGQVPVALLRSAVAQAGETGLDGPALAALADAVENEARAEYMINLRSVLIVFIGLLVSSIIIFSVFVLEIYRNVTILREQLTVKGQGMDLSRRIHITCNDDLGYLAGGINELMDKLAHTFGEVKELSRRVYASSREAGGLLEETRMKAEDITQSLKRVESGTDEESLEIEGVARSVEGLTAVLAESYRSAKEQSASASEILSRTRVFLEAFEVANRESAEIQGFFQELDTALREAGSEVDKTKQAALETVEMGRRVSEIVSLISDVADRSNLLAMNASIEAAHAGSAGKGFAVVAGEIRKLSESSTRSAADIIMQIKAMQEKNSEGVRSIEELTGSFGALGERILAAGNKLSAQAVSFGKHSDDARETMAGLQDLLVISRRVETAAESQLHEQERIQASIRKLEDSTQALKAETIDLLNGVKDVLNLNRILDADMRSNFAAVDDLEAMIGVYKLD